MPSASENGSGPRYAPEDKELPKPWKGLVDGSTGYLYYWNPETNVTQYEKPVKEKLPGPPRLPPPPAGKPASVSSSVHRGEPRDEDGRGRSHQHQGGRGSHSHTAEDAERGHGHSTHGSKASARAHGTSDAGGGLSVEAYRRQHEITIDGDDIPPPYMSFESTGFPSEILKEVHRAGFAAPTPIQAQSWPIALKGCDVVAIAKTGSGKTLGYLIPGFIHLKRVRSNPKMGPTVLVLAPTRELATQIQDEADKFGRSSKITCTCVYGGAPKGPQLRELDRGVDVVVATPGRLNDVLEMRRVNLRQVTYLVLDEADRMLDMGFEPQIRKIVKEIPNRRQTLMFTATWPKEVRRIAADLLVHPVQVNIGNIDELVANKAITQYVEVLKPTEKQRRLEQILRSQEPRSKVIIFCSTKRMCDQLAKTLTRLFGAAAIHGDKNQTERDRVLGHFRTGKCPILVATDVAARGLDIKDIRVVINYDFPTGVEDYVHRIGRTGRAGATGVAYTFFSDQDRKYALELVKVLEGADQRVPPELQDMVSRGGFGGRSRRWGSGARDRARANGMGHADPVHGGRGGRGLPPLGRSDSDRAVHRGDRDSRDRFPRDRGHQDRHEPEPRAREEPKVRDGIKTTTRGKACSHSLSPSPKKAARVGWSRSQSQSRSRSRSPILDKKIRRRSKSRSTSPVVDRHGRPLTRRPESPVLKRRETLADDRARVRSDPSHSPAKRKSSSTSYDDGEIRDDHMDQSPSPRKSRSGSPVRRRDVRPRRISSPLKEKSRSPVRVQEERTVQLRDVRLRRTPSQERPRSPVRAPEGRLHRSPVRSRDGRLRRTPSQERRPRSPVRGKDKRPHRSPVRTRDDRSPSPLKGRSRSPIRGPEDRQLRLSSIRSRDSRPRRTPSQERSRSPVRGPEDRRFYQSKRDKKSRSPVRGQEDRLRRSLSPRKRSHSPYTYNGTRGGSASPNGTSGVPIDNKPLESRPSAYEGDEEEEEGMFHPDEELNPVD